MFGGEMGLALDNCCYCFPNREGGSSTEHANDEGRISIKISIDIPTKVSHLFEDLAEWSLPDGSTIGGEEEISIADVQSTLDDIAEWILPDDKVYVAIPEEGAREDR